MTTITIRKTRKGTTITAKAGKGEDLRKVLGPLLNPKADPDKKS